MRLRTSFALLLGSAMLLTGCASEEPEPKFAEPSASPSVVKKEETAEEFIRRWAKVEQEMQNTGETEEYRSITKGCPECGRLAKRMEKIYGDGGWVEAGKTTIQRTEDKGSNIYLVWTSTEASTHSLTDKGPQGSFAGGKSLYEIHLVKRGDEWAMLSLIERTR